jgi:hypothetical protein
MQKLIVLGTNHNVQGQSAITVQARSSRTVSGIVLDERTIVTTASAISDGETIRAWDAPEETGFRWGIRSVRRFRGSTLQRGRGGDERITMTDEIVLVARPKMPRLRQHPNDASEIARFCR